MLRSSTELVFDTSSGGGEFETAITLGIYTLYTLGKLGVEDIFCSGMALRHPPAICTDFHWSQKTRDVAFANGAFWVRRRSDIEIHP